MPVTHSDYHSLRRIPGNPELNLPLPLASGGVDGRSKKWVHNLDHMTDPISNQRKVTMEKNPARQNLRRINFSPGCSKNMS